MVQSNNASFDWYFNKLFNDILFVKYKEHIKNISKKPSKK